LVEIEVAMGPGFVVVADVLVSRSWTRRRIGSDRPSRGSERLRAIWVHQARFAGPVGHPADQYNKSTCRVFSRIDSTVTRSRAMIEDA
jgi:hypothetical protein